tara:strand:+ start:148 stop:486 length:339 start_codon:yes stop_codon:yes gene_type:complete
MSIQYRTVLHAGSTNEIYSPLFPHYPRQTSSNSGEHHYCKFTLSQLVPDAGYSKLDLCDSGMEGLELYTHIVEQLDAGYMDAIEFTKAQAKTMIGLNQLDELRSKFLTIDSA